MTKLEGRAGLPFMPQIASSPSDPACFGAQMLYCPCQNPFVGNKNISHLHHSVNKFL